MRCLFFPAFLFLFFYFLPSAALGVEIQWLGHSSFKLIYPGNHVLLTDPYDDTLGYPLPKKKMMPDVVLISNDHFDHNDIKRLKGNPLVIRKEGITRYYEIKFVGIKSYCDDVNGLKRGENIIYRWRWQGMEFCFLGDLAHLLTEKQVKAIGKVDILFVPIGGIYTLDGPKARQVILQLNPSIIFPMHYKTESLNPNWISLATEEPFLKEIKAARIRKLDTDRIKIVKEDLPKTGMEIIFLQPPKGKKTS